MAETKREAAGEMETLSIEEMFGQLDGIIGKLEDGELPLEESFQYYEEGMRLVKACSRKVDQVEKRILVLGETEDETE